MLGSAINIFLIVFIIISLILSVWFCYQTRVMGELTIKKYLEGKTDQQNLNTQVDNKNNNFVESEEGNGTPPKMVNQEPPIK